MKLLCLILMTGGILLPASSWKTDFKQAKSEAAQHHKFILLNFSGSDWCIPCMRLKKEIFDTDIFDAYAAESLELVNADFPRNKKNKLPAELAKQNDSLAAVYNNDGKFPYTLLLNENGKVLKAWDGFPNVTPAEFVDQIKKIADAGH
jgi:thioredoxin-related protein